MVIIMKEIQFKVKHFPFGCLLWKGCFILCCFTNTHDQITFDEPPQIRMQLTSRFCAVCAWRRGVRFCSITELAAPGANHKPLQAVPKTARVPAFHAHPTSARIPARRSRLQGCASGGGSISPLRRARPRGENSPLPGHGALLERKAAGFNPFALKAQVCHTLHLLLIPFTALPLFLYFPLPPPPPTSLFLYFKRGKELKEAAKGSKPPVATFQGPERCWSPQS